MQNELCDKGKTSQSWWRKATGPRFLRHAFCDATKDPKIAGLPILVTQETEVIMSRACRVVFLVGALMLCSVGIAFEADPVPGEGEFGNSCFQETVKVKNGVNPDLLSTLHCTRALRDKPISRRNESAMLYNRGIIQSAQGDLVAARASFKRAVGLSRTVDKRNLALAETARELGDYRVAMEQYDRLVDSDFAVGSDDLRTAVLARRQQVDSAYFASVEKAQVCTGCHGAKGISGNPHYPTLAGRQGDYLEHALRQFKNGGRQHATMTAQAMLIADDDIPVLAGYFASIDRP